MQKKLATLILASVILVFSSFSIEVVNSSKPPAIKTKSANRSQTVSLPNNKDYSDVNCSELDDDAGSTSVVTERSSESVLELDKYTEIKLKNRSKLQRKTKGARVRLDVSDVEVEEAQAEQNDQNDRKFSLNSVDKIESIKLRNELAELVRLQLNLDAKTKIRFTEFVIVNWPPFTSVSYRTWDAVNIAEIRAAMSSLRFYFNEDLESIILQDGEHVLVDRFSERRKLLERLVAKFQGQLNSSSKRILWSSVSITGWPVDVHLQSDSWNSVQVNQIYRALDEIEFKWIEPGENRTITYLSGKTDVLEPYELLREFRKKTKAAVGSNLNIFPEKRTALNRKQNRKSITLTPSSSADIVEQEPFPLALDTNNDIDNVFNSFESDSESELELGTEILDNCSLFLANDLEGNGDSKQFNRRAGTVESIGGYLSDDDPNTFELIQSVLQNLSDTDTDTDTYDESENCKYYIPPEIQLVANDSAPILALSGRIEENNSDGYDHGALAAAVASTALGKRKLDRENKEPSNKYVRSDHKCRLIKKALAEDLKVLFIQQTGDVLENYHQYEILNYPVDSTKRGTTLNLKEVELIRNVFETLKFVKIPADGTSKKVDLQLNFSNEKQYNISIVKVRHIIYDRFCNESGDMKAIHINWSLIDLSKIPDRFSETFEIIRSGRIPEFKHIFKITQILDNIHFFKADAKILARKGKNHMIEARRILLEQYRKDMCLPNANKIYWDRVKSISGLEEINYKFFNRSGAREIINRKDQIKFEPKTNVKIDN